jgi:hypothetical protein
MGAVGDRVVGLRGADARVGAERGGDQQVPGELREQGGTGTLRRR